MKRSTVIALLGSILFIAQCGPMDAASLTNSKCTPNVVGSGLTLQVTKIQSNGVSKDYIFKLCNNANPSGAYSVYGSWDTNLLTPSQISSNNRRLTSVSASSTGDEFQVSFASTDTSFAIYLDSNNTQMVPPRLLP